MFHQSIANLLSNKLRLALTSIAIILGVSFVAGTYIFTDSIGSAFETLFDDINADIDLIIRPTEDSGLEGINESLVDQLSSIESIEKVEAVIDGYAQLVDKDNKPIGGQGPPTIGASWIVNPEFKSLNIPDGNGREPTSDNEVLIDIATAKANNFKLDDNVNIIGVNGVEEFKIVGLAKFGAEDGLSGATLSVFTFNKSQQFMNLQGKTSEINIKIKEGGDLEETRQAISDTLDNSNIEAITGEEQSNESLNEITSALGFVNTAILAFAAIALFVGSFIIQNTYRIILAQRSKELALYRAIGATRGQVIKMVMYEAILVALIASAIGILVGLLNAKGITFITDKAGFSLPTGSTSLKMRTIIYSFIVGVVITVFSSLLPAIKSSRISPVEALSDNPSNKKNKNLTLRIVFGALLTAISILLILNGLIWADSSQLQFTGSGVALMFISISMLAPFLIKPITVLIAFVLGGKRNSIVNLAKDNTLNQPKRASSAASSLMIGMSLVVLISIFANSIKSTIDTILSDSFPADITITSSNIGDNGPGTAEITGDIEGILSNINVVKDITKLSYFSTTVNGTDNVLVVATETDTFDNVITLGVTAGSTADVTNDSIMIRDTKLEELEKTIGDTVSVVINDIARDLTISNSFVEAFDSNYIISYGLIEEAKTVNPTLILLNYADGVDSEAAKEEINEKLAVNPTVSAVDQEGLKEQAVNQIDQILNLIYALLAFSVLIAILGIANTLSLSISERTKEIGLLRSIGMTRRQLKNMVRVESIIISLFGTFLGIIMGVFFSRLLIKVLEDEGLSAYSIPYTQMLFFILLSVLAGILASIWPASRAARMNILDAINSRK